MQNEQQPQGEQHTLTALSIGTNLPVLRWALGHAGQIQDLIAALKEIGVAQGAESKWAAIKSAGDLVITILADFPKLDSGRLALFGTEQCSEEQAKELALQFDGHIIQLIVSNLPAIIEFISKLLPLLTMGA